MFDRSHPPDSVCILRLSAIGDCCHSLAAVRCLQDAWPNTRFLWIIGSIERTLFKHMRDIEFLVVDKSQSNWVTIGELRRRLAGRRFDLLLHMHPNARANLLSLFIRAKLRVGYDRPWAKELQWLFTNKKVASPPNQHVLDSLLQFPAAFGIETDKLRWDIPLAADDREFADQTIVKHKSILAINPSTSPKRGRRENLRSWRAERYAAVADYAVQQYGAQVLLTGGPNKHELEFGSIIEQAMRTQADNLIGKTSLTQLLALLERADALISPDTGPAHMATAVGTPVIGLYAGSNPDRAGPYLSKEWTVSRFAEAVRAEYGVSPEHLSWNLRVNTPFAMDMIQVPEVTAKIDKLFELPQTA